jgi:hypothetical protein
VAQRTFTATRPPAAGDGRWLASWELAQGAAALVANFCEETSAAPIFQIQLPANASASQAYAKPIRCPNGGRWHVELVSGGASFVRGGLDLV